MITIYALVDPRTDLIRYVGKTSRPVRERFRAHINRAHQHRHIKSAAWLCDLAERGISPGLIELEFVESNWQPAERFWIASFRALGFDLLNMTIGGAATRGCEVSEATRAKISANAKRQFSDPTNRMAAAEYGRGPWKDPAFREKKIEQLRAMSADQEYRKNQSEKKKQRWLDPDYRSRVLQTKKDTGCHIAGALKMWERPEYRQRRDALIDAKCARDGRIRGVCFNKRRGNWIAQKTHLRKHYNLGAYATKEEAESAVLKAESILRSLTCGESFDAEWRAARDEVELP